VAFTIALGIICLSLAIKWYQDSKIVADVYYTDETRPALGEPGSEHSHMSILVFIDGKAFDFSVPEFQLKSEYIHFEDGDGITIHKHAKGATLRFLLQTLGIDLTSDCFRVSDKEEYCVDVNKTLRAYLNREPFVDWASYELRKGDKILIDYGTSTKMDIELKLNAVPDLPENL